MDGLVNEAAHTTPGGAVGKSFVDAAGKLGEEHQGKIKEGVDSIKEHVLPGMRRIKEYLVRKRARSLVE